MIRTPAWRFRRRALLRIVVAVAIASTATFQSPTPPVEATKPAQGAYVYGNLVPGDTLVAAGRNWSLPVGVQISYTWYRCDSYHPNVELTTDPIAIPADCSLAKGPLTGGNPDHGETYMIDPDVGLGQNADEGKYLTVFLEDNDSTPKHSLAETLSNFVIVNRNGGTSNSDGMRIVLANGSVQVYRNNTAQTYPQGANAPASTGPALLAEGKLVLPEDRASNDVNILWAADSPPTQEAWDSTSTEMVSEDLVTGSFHARTVLSKTFAGSGRHYDMTVDLSYTSPSQVATLTFSVTIPAGASSPVHLYYAMDMYLDGNDYGPGRTLILGNRRLVTQYNNTGFGGLLEGGGPRFTSWVEAYYECVFGFTKAAHCPTPYGPVGTPYPNTVNPNVVDTGVAAEWLLGSSAGTITRRAQLAFADSREPAINVSYSQSSVRTNKQILTYIDVLNAANPIPVDDLDFELELPTATYGPPSSTCGGTLTLDTSVSPPLLTLSNGDLLTGDPSSPSSMSRCQIAIPTTFPTVGVYTVNSTNLMSSYWRNRDDHSSNGSIIDLLGDALDVTADGPFAETTDIDVNSDPATSIGMTTATLHGRVTATGVPADASFCWGTSSTLSSCTTVAATPDIVVPTDGELDISATLTGLSPGVQYYFQVIGVNGIQTKYASILSFTTENCWEELSGGNIGATERVLRFTYSPIACTWSVPSGVSSARVLAVAGGGGGGAPCVGGGGGAGGVREMSSLAVTGSIAVTVGRGGAGATGAGCSGGRGANGEDSSFGALVNVTGGGGGGSYNQGFNGGNGGSGGGGSGGAGGGTPGVHYGIGGTGVTGQGFAGSDGEHDVPGNPGGGGGGAGGRGVSPVSDEGGFGGPGYSSDIAGSSAFYGAGGGGASDNAGKGGQGGSTCGGHGAASDTDASAATGYGCGGGGGNGSHAGAAGSDGVIIVRYAAPTTTTTTTIPSSTTTTTSPGGTTTTNPGGTTTTAPGGTTTPPPFPGIPPIHLVLPPTGSDSRNAMKLALLLCGIGLTAALSRRSRRLSETSPPSSD